MKDPELKQEDPDGQSRRARSLSSLGRSLQQARDLLLSKSLEQDLAIDFLDQLSQRLSNQRFHLAVLGQFKRGKSTLINALVGAQLLPASVIPLTSIPTLVEFGERLEMFVHYAKKHDVEHFDPDDAAQTCSLLSKFVTEEKNPRNRLEIDRVMIRAPSALLRHQVVLIDTPGIGSTNIHNSLTTREFLSQCDAAIFVVSADPPLTEQEAKFLSLVREHVEKIFFVMNKIDYLQDGQREEALSFLLRTLSKTCGVDEPGPVFCVSAYQALQAKINGDEVAFCSSGMDELQAHLKEFFLGDKSTVLFDAISSKARDVVGQSLMQLELRQRSIRMPLEQLEKSLAIFDSKIEDIHRERQIAEDRLDGDERRATAYLESCIERLRHRIREELGGVLNRVLIRMDEGQAGESDLSTALETEVPGCFQRELVAMADEISSHIQGLLDERRQEADALMAAVRKAAADIFDIPFRAPSASSVFKIDTRVFWNTHKWTPSYSPIPEGSLDRLLPAKQRRKRLENRWHKQIDALVEQNSETLRWELLQGMKKAFWSYKSSLDVRLRATLDATQGAIRSALDRRKSHSEQVAGSLKQIDTTISKLKDWMEKQF